MCLLEVVSWHHWEQVVVDLVLKTSTEPVNECLGNAMASCDIAGGGHLQLPEIRPGISIVGGHAVVAKSKDEGQHQSTEACGGEEVHEGVGNREPAKSTGECGHPYPVKSDSNFLQNRVLKTLAFAL
mmetsp:Transcript_26907/g.48925  ORF Transcript_26907/g.48925 Transcript_26907/m.48925 type:complete len:127 (-) Transcript_26907:995-1375(-)